MHCLVLSTSVSYCIQCSRIRFLLFFQISEKRLYINVFLSTGMSKNVKIVRKVVSLVLPNEFTTFTLNFFIVCYLLSVLLLWWMHFSWPNSLYHADVPLKCCWLTHAELVEWSLELHTFLHFSKGTKTWLYVILSCCTRFLEHWLCALPQWSVAYWA